MRLRRGRFCRHYAHLRPPRGQAPEGSARTAPATAAPAGNVTAPVSRACGLLPSGGMPSAPSFYVQPHALQDLSGASRLTFLRCMAPKALYRAALSSAFCSASSSSWRHICRPASPAAAGACRCPVAGSSAPVRCTHCTQECSRHSAATRGARELDAKADDSCTSPGASSDASSAAASTSTGSPCE